MLAFEKELKKLFATESLKSTEGVRNSLEELFDTKIPHTCTIDPIQAKSQLKRLEVDLASLRLNKKTSMWLSKNQLEQNILLTIYDDKSPDGLYKNNKVVIDNSIGKLIKYGLVSTYVSMDIDELTSSLNQLQEAVDKAIEYKKSDCFFYHSIDTSTALSDASAIELALIKNCYNNILEPKGIARFSQEQAERLNKFIEQLREQINILSKIKAQPGLENEKYLFDVFKAKSEQQTTEKTIEELVYKIRNLANETDAKTRILSFTDSYIGIAGAAGMCFKSILQTGLDNIGVGVSLYRSTPEMTRLIELVNKQEDFIDLLKTKALRDFIANYTSHKSANNVLNEVIFGIIKQLKGDFSKLEIKGIGTIQISNQTLQKLIHIAGEILKKTSQDIILNNSSKQIDKLLLSLHSLISGKEISHKQFFEIISNILKTIDDFIVSSKDKDTKDSMKNLSAMLSQEVDKAIDTMISMNKVKCQKELVKQTSSNTNISAEINLTTALLSGLARLSPQVLSDTYTLLTNKSICTATKFEMLSKQTDLVEIVLNHAEDVKEIIEYIVNKKGINTRHLLCVDNDKLSNNLDILTKYIQTKDKDDILFMRLAKSYCLLLESNKPLDEYIIECNQHKDDEIKAIGRRVEAYKVMTTEDPPIEKYHFAFREIIREMNQNQKKKYSKIISYLATIDKLQQIEQLMQSTVYDGNSKLLQTKLKAVLEWNNDEKESAVLKNIRQIQINNKNITTLIDKVEEYMQNEEGSANNPLSDLRNLVDTSLRHAQKMISPRKIFKFKKSKNDQFTAYIEMKIAQRKFNQGLLRLDTSDPIAENRQSQVYSNLCKKMLKFESTLSKNLQKSLFEFYYFEQDFLLAIQARLNKQSPEKPVGYLFKLREMIYNRSITLGLMSQAQKKARILKNIDNDVGQVLEDCKQLYDSYKDKELASNDALLMSYYNELEYFKCSANMKIVDSAIDMLMNTDPSRCSDYDAALADIFELGLDLGLMHKWTFDAKYTRKRENYVKIEDTSGFFIRCWRYLELYAIRFVTWLWGNAPGAPLRDTLKIVQKIVRGIMKDKSFSVVLTKDINKNLLKICQAKEVSELTGPITLLIPGLVKHLKTLNPKAKKALGMYIKGIVAYSVNDKVAQEKFEKDYNLYMKTKTVVHDKFTWTKIAKEHKREKVTKKEKLIIKSASVESPIVKKISHSQKIKNTVSKKNKPGKTKKLVNNI